SGAADPAAAGDPDPPAAVPAQLPADIDDFTGRAEHLAQAERFLGAARTTVMPVWVVTGTAGVGKSSLAIRAAHRLRARFPDGQLHVNLHGAGVNPHGAGIRPLDPADVLAQFLRALGVPDRLLPDDLDERVRLYRTRLADRRVLVVLDDAADEAQVRPLLPGGPGCATVVTSRTRLSGLAGARTVTLDVLDREQAVTLLATGAGQRRVAAEPEAAERIVQLCGRLPLAVRIAAARLAGKPHWSLAGFARRLADGRRRLDELRVGDLDVRAGFQLSYDSLAPPGRRALRRLALLDQPSCPVWTAAALLDTDPDTAEELLEELVDAQLLQVSRGGAGGGPRYHCHELLRAYGAEQLRAEETPQACEAAVEAALGAALARAELAAGAMMGGPAPADDPRVWFADEQTNLTALVAQAHRAGRWEVTWRLAQALSMFLEERSQWSAWRHSHELARAAARAAGRIDVEAALEQRLGDLYRDRGQFQRAQLHFQRSLELAGALGSALHRAYALRGLGDVHWGQGRVTLAVASYEEALPILDAAGDTRGAAYALRGLSVAYRGLGRLGPALDAARQCVRAFDSIGDRAGAAYARRTLGSVHLDLTAYDRAVACFEQCRTEFVALGDRLGEAAALLGLGMTRVEQERFAEALAAYTDCRRAFADVADPLGEAYARRGLGDALAGLGRLAEALVELRAALAVFVAEGDLRWQGYALFSLGGVELARGRPAEAEQLLTRSLHVFERLDARLWQDRALLRISRLRQRRQRGS
ncbi:MAG TPA: tetratricopeptide repeat protein, partial [Micromonospora sp.]